MTQLSFLADANSQLAIEELKEFFGTRSTASAIRSALLLARTAAKVSKDGTIVIKDQDRDENVRIVVAG